MREIIVGKYQGRYLTLKDEGFVLLAAPTGSNKGVAVMLPNLLNFPDSMVVLDIKLENFRYTSLFRQRHGHRVYLWAPFAEDGRTHCWNMLDAIPRDSLFRVGEILAIAQAFYPSDCDPKEKFWNDNARNLFLALVLYLLETPELPCTMAEVLRQSSGRGRPLKDYLQEVIDARAEGDRRLSPECLDALHRFLSTPENTLGNVISTFNAPLLVFTNPVVDAATSRSDFNLADILRQRMTIYIGIQPNRLADAALLVNLFVSQLIDQNTRHMPDTDPSIRYQCLLGLDELPALGKIKILAKANAYIRAYGLRLLTIVQSVAQLVAIYGEADARTLMTNHALQIVFAPREQADADEYSKYLGFSTERAISKGTSRNRGIGGGASTSENTSDQARALMLPQELKAMPRHQQIILLEGTRPILCDKARYYEDHRFLDRLKSTSLTLARLDQTTFRRWMRAAHLYDFSKSRPSEHTLKHVAYVLEELSVNVPRLDLRSQTTPPSTPDLSTSESNAKANANANANSIVPLAKEKARETAKPEPGLPPLDINQLGRIPARLPTFADAKHPSVAEAQAIVTAFFGPMEHGDDAVDAPRYPSTTLPAKTTRRRRKAANSLEPLSPPSKKKAAGQAGFNFDAENPPINLSKLDE
jgi:type IV secretion system protein VirD4